MSRWFLANLGFVGLVFSVVLEVSFQVLLILVLLRYLGWY